MPIGRMLLKSISGSNKMSKLRTDGARLLYTWLIPHLDINGCYSGDAEVIKGNIFTRLKKSTKTIELYLKDIEGFELIFRYEANGDIFLIVPDFDEKQPSLNPTREAKPTTPLPTLEQIGSLSGPTQDKLKHNINEVKLSKDKPS